MTLAAFDPAFRAGLIALANQAEDNLGLDGTHLAMVCHAQRPGIDGPVYEASLACDAAPQLISEMVTARALITPA